MKKILIVDDDKTGITPLVIRLRAAGYKVFTAADGVAGLKQAVHEQPNLIIMDVWMPHGIGILTAQRLKHVGLANVPLIFLTACKKDEIWALAEEVQPAAFFEKPYDSKEILAEISLLLARVDPLSVATLAESQLSAVKNPNHNKN